MRINYLSYGVVETGGYRHEKYLFDSLCALVAEKEIVEQQSLRKNKLFTTWISYFELLWWSWRNSTGDINIVGGRTALAALLRNVVGKKEVWVVLHNFDENDGKSKLLKWYFNMLFYWLKNQQSKRFKVIAIAPYWVNYFKQKFSSDNVYLFPNLFDVKQYEPYQNITKEKRVHLGQWSSKNDDSIFQLARLLSEKDYYCYFSTLEPEMSAPHNGQYEVKYFNEFNSYLSEMARCCCTIAFTRINEGWNRIGHESILVHTPVIGYKKGGLGDFLKESNSIIANNAEEAYTCIVENKWSIIDKSFIDTYSKQKTNQYLEPICNDH
ncbi:MAG: hypothetical protein V4613_09925 [Bacteroidota bacterium]